MEDSASASHSEGWKVGKGRELRAPGSSFPTGEPLGQDMQWRVGLLGGGAERDAPPTSGREKILFVCSLQLLFQETQAYGSGWCGGRVWVVYLLLPLPFAW